MELNHKLFKIYGAEKKPVTIVNPKETFLKINGKQNGATLNDVCREIEELGEGEIYAWSVLENYKVEDGYLVDSEGNQISFVQGDEEVFFSKITKAFIPEWAKEVNLEYIKMMGTLLGMNAIEETITGLSNEDKQILVEERMTANEKRQREIQKEKADADAREKQQLEAERKRLEKEQAEEQERLDILQKEEEVKQKEEEEKAKQEAEEKKKIAAEKKRQQEEEEEIEKTEKQKQAIEAQKIADEAKRKKERAENENVYSPEQYSDLRDRYLEMGFTDYVTSDEKYIFFYGEASQIEEGEKPFIIVKTSDDYEELEGGKMTVDNEKIADYKFKHEGKNKAVTLTKKTDTIRVQVIA